MEQLIKLNDKYYIGADRYNWILYTTSINKKTKVEEVRAHKFYPTLEYLLEQVLEMNLRGLCMDNKSLSSLVISMSNERKKWLKQVKTMCEGIKKERLYDKGNNTNETTEP